MTARERAFRVLERVERDNAYASLLLQIGGEDARDLAFIRTIVLGVLRWRNRLDAIIERLSKRKTSGIDRPALQILRIGVYQIALMDVPDYAAVGESVTMAHRFAPRASGFVNAVLRTAAREKDRLWEGSGLPEDLRLGHPAWILGRWASMYGRERAERIAAADQELSFPDLFVDERKISLGEAADLLARKGVAFQPSPVVGGVMRLWGSTETVREEIEEGLFYPMDEGSAAIGRIATSLAGQGTLLDVAAAPGGKSIVAALGGARVTANDLSYSRLRYLVNAAPGLGGGSLQLLVSDGTLLPLRRMFDTVLLDAPCTATGTLRKSPEIKWRLRPEMIEASAAMQKLLLRASLAVSRFHCLYSTCSLEPEENDGVVEEVLATAPGFELADLSDVVPETLQPWIASGVLRLTPEAGSDGFTAHLLRRRGRGRET